MQTLIHADLFFFVASIGFVLFAALCCIALYYLIRVLRRLSRIMETIERTVDATSEEIRSFIGRLEESGIVRMLFRKKQKRTK